MNKKEQILQLVAEYIKEQHAAKTWEAGKDWVQYAGPYFDENLGDPKSSPNGQWVMSRQDRKHKMKELGLAEIG